MGLPGEGFCGCLRGAWKVSLALEVMLSPRHPGKGWHGGAGRLEGEQRFALAWKPQGLPERGPAGWPEVSWALGSHTGSVSSPGAAEMGPCFKFGKM